MSRRRFAIILLLYKNNKNTLLIIIVILYLIIYPQTFTQLALSDDCSQDDDFERIKLCFFYDSWYTGIII